MKDSATNIFNLVFNHVDNNGDMEPLDREEVIGDIGKMVEAYAAEAVLAEREACAKVAESLPLFGEDGDIATSPTDIAKSIRERSRG